MKALHAAWLAGFCLCASLTACERDRPAPKPGQVASAKPNAHGPEEGRTTSNVDLSDIPVPTEEDFEEAAERDITIDNLESELDRMEKEIVQ